VREDGNEIPLRETLDARLVGVTVMARLDLGIDLFAGPTEVLIVSDEHADPFTIATILRHFDPKLKINSSCATSRVLSDWSWLERNYWYIKGAKVAPIKSDEVYEIDTYYKCKNSIL